MKTEAGMMDPRRRIHLHSSNFYLFWCLTRGGQFSRLIAFWPEVQRPVTSLAANFCMASSSLIVEGDLVGIPHTGAVI